MRAVRVSRLYCGGRLVPSRLCDSVRREDKTPPNSPHNVQSRSLSHTLGAETELSSRLDNLRSLFQFPRSRLNLRQLDQLNQLVVLLSRFPETSPGVWEMGLVPTLLELQSCGQPEVEKKARLALTLLGHSPPCAGRGLRILSVDGGGTRSVLILKMLGRSCRVLVRLLE